MAIQLVSSSDSAGAAGPVQKTTRQAQAVAREFGVGFHAELRTPTRAARYQRAVEPWQTI